MELQIGKDTLVALAAVVWADGEMAPEEAGGIRDAAGSVQLSPEDEQAVEHAIKVRVTLDQVETIRMNRLTRLFTYAVAAWVVQLKGHVDAKEEQALRLLGDRLGLSNIARERARAAALGIGDLPPGQVRQRFDLKRLQSRLSASLSQVGLD